MLVEQQLRAVLTSAFRFVVSVNGVPLGAFTECTLPSVDLDVQNVEEGGLNAFVHQLPGRRKPTKLVLKNGVGASTHLLSLYQKAMNEKCSRLHLTVTLLNPLRIPVMTLDIRDAYPTKWTGPQLRTGENTVAVQTLELVCGEVTVL